MVLAIGGWRVGETRLKMKWRLTAGRENANTWTYLQKHPRVSEEHWTKAEMHH
jgi:hypothetical protein